MGNIQFGKLGKAWEGGGMRCGYQKRNLKKWRKNCRPWEDNAKPATWIVIEDMYKFGSERTIQLWTFEIFV